MGWAVKRRSATRWCDGPDRGLKPTATVTQSLRDAEGVSRQAVRPPKTARNHVHRHQLQFFHNPR